MGYFDYLCSRIETGKEKDMTEEKDFYDGGNSMTVFDDISMIPRNADGKIELDRLMVFVCCEGTIQLRIKDQLYELGPSQGFICLPKIELNRILLSPGARTQVFGFSVDAIDQIVFIKRSVTRHVSQLWQPQVIDFSSADMQMISHLYDFVKLMREMSNRSHYQQMMLNLQQAVFYAMADTVNTLPMVDKTEEPVNNKDQLFKQFLSLVGTSNGRIRSVKTFADMLNITPKYLSVVVREVSGKTPTDWIQYYVVNVIAQRLTQTKKTIKEISVELNFPNPSFFGRFVREHLGCSPKEYREKYSSQA